MKFTDEEIAGLKVKHGNDLYCIPIPLGEGRVSDLVFKKPSIITLSAVLQVGKTDDVRASQLLCNSCYVAGNKDLLEDVNVFVAVSSELNKLIKPLQVTIKKI